MRILGMDHQQTAFYHRVENFLVTTGFDPTSKNIVVRNGDHSPYTEGEWLGYTRSSLLRFIAEIQGKQIKDESEI